ncbi:MAG: TlpA disulfide reductase family protein [Candidatus Spechtbacterales bacterium]|nr:TlpA disulfide reductase family protein [Candidatus Spechtbacterales bacterium]
MNKKLIIFNIILASLAAGVLFLVFRSNNGTEVEGVELEDYSDPDVSLENYRGTPIVANAWAAWCPFCVEELPEFAKVQDEFEGEVIILAINREESVGTMQRFLNKVDLTFSDLEFLEDSEDTFYREIGGISMPETLFIDAQGNIVHHKKGPMRAPEIREKIQDIL